MKKIFLGGLFLIILLAVGGYLYFQPFKDLLKNLTEEARAEDSNIMISKFSDGWNSESVITLATTDEPSVWMRTNNESVTNKTKVSIYKADENVLLNFLIHDKEGKIINKKVDYKKLILIKSFEPKSTDSTDSKTKILLPLSGAGIFYMRVANGNEIKEIMIVRSGIGVVVKEAETDMVFWAQDLKTGKSLTGGKIKLFNLQDKKKELGNISFNGQGLANIKMKTDYEVALAQVGSDIALVTINLALEYNWNNNHYLVPPLTSNRFFTFTDRPIYKPGDTIYFKSIVRDENDAIYHLASGQATVGVRYNWETDIFPAQNFTIKTNGTIDGEFKLPTNAPVGDYQLEIRTQDSSNPDNSSSDQVYFQVEQYRKPEYNLEIEATKTMVIAGDQAEFKLSGNYFFGQPLANQKIKYTITSNKFWNDYYMTSQDLEGGYYGYWNGDDVASDEVVLDKFGQATIKFDTKPKADEAKATKIFSIEATYEDSTGNSVLARKNIMVLKGEYQLRQVNDNGYEGMVNELYTLNLGLETLNNENKADVELTAKISQENWQYNRKPDGSYDIVHETNVLPEQKVKTDQAGKAQIKFTPKKSGSYDILITAVDQKGNVIDYSFYAWIYQPGEMVYFNGDFKGLTIKTDKESYQPGETAKLNIISDVGERDVLLSFERGYVRRWQVLKLNKGVTKVDVPIVGTDMPNIFAEIRGFAPSQKVTQIQSFGQNISVPANSKRLSLQIEADKPVYGPGETASLTVKTLDNKNNPVATDLALWAVDRAIFELSDSNLGDIYNAYWFDRYNDTQESNSLQSIFINSSERGGCFTGDTEILMADNTRRAIVDLKVGDEIMTKTSNQDTELVKAKITKTHSAEVPGYLIINGDLKLTPNHKLFVNDDWQMATNIKIGDKLVGEDNQSIEVKSVEWYLAKTKVYNIDVATYHTFIANGIWVHNEKGGGGRSTFKDTAYWNASVRTDESGIAKVKVVLPDNLTTWTVAAVAATGDTMVGQTTKEILVTKNVIVRPVLPNIMRVGDLITVSALVQNYTDKDREFNVGLDSDNLEISMPYITKQIKSGGMEEIYWQVKPTKIAESAKLKFFAYAADDKSNEDTIIATLPIWSFGFTEQISEFANGAKTFQIKLPPDALNNQSQVKLMLSSSLLGSLPAAMEYLLDYPYGCVEQTTSHFVPVVIARLNAGLFSEAIKNKDLDAMVVKGVDHLAELQNSSGAWGWWYDETTKPFVSAYVLEYLLKAQSTGIKIDDTVITRAKKYFTSSWSEDENNKSESIAKYYALGLMGTKAKFKFNFDLSQLTPDKIALAVMANYMAGNTDPATNGLSILEAKANRSNGQASWASGDYDLFGSVDASTALAMRAIMLAHGNLDLVREGARYLLENRQKSYWSNTFATAQIIQAVVDLHKIDQQGSANSSYQVLLNGAELTSGRIADNTKSVEILISTSSLNLGLGTLEVKPDEGAVLYSNFIVKEFRTDPNAPAMDNGLKVKREYISSRDDGKFIAVGDRVTVVTTVTGLKEGDRYVVVDDELPSGLIPINANLKNNQASNDEQRYFYFDIGYKLNGASMSTYYVYAGDTVFKYDARAVSSGVFQVPPVSASLMYTPTTLGRSAAQSLEIFTLDKLPVQTATVLPEITKKTIGKYWLWIIIGLAVVFLSFFIVWFRKRWSRFKLYQAKQAQSTNDTTQVSEQDHYDQDKS